MGCLVNVTNVALTLTLAIKHGFEHKRTAKPLRSSDAWHAGDDVGGSDSRHGRLGNAIDGCLTFYEAIFSVSVR